jgi:hypothetical protein
MQLQSPRSYSLPPDLLGSQRRACGKFVAAAPSCPSSTVPTCHSCTSAWRCHLESTCSAIPQPESHWNNPCSPIGVSDRHQSKGTHECTDAEQQPPAAPKQATPNNYQMKLVDFICITRDASYGHEDRLHRTEKITSGGCAAQAMPTWWTYKENCRFVPSKIKV